MMRIGFPGKLCAAKFDGASTQRSANNAKRFIVLSPCKRSAICSVDLDPQPAHELLDGGNFGGEPRGQLFRRPADDLIAGAVRLLARLRSLQRRLALLRKERDDLRRRPR